MNGVEKRRLSSSGLKLFRKSLNADVVGPLLVAKIDEEDWKINIKALVVMEAMAKDAACAAYADYFYDNSSTYENRGRD